MADIKEAIRRLIYEYVVEGADKVMATQEAVAASTTKTDKASLSLEKSFGSLERRYVDTVRHQQDYAKVQEKVNAAVAQNPALQERANAVLAAAGEHFDKLALNAGKGSIATSFLSKAISGLLGPAGLMGVAMTAVGTAVGYMAAQFQSSSTTIEESLKEQERLFGALKTQIDAKASAEAKAQAQSINVSLLQNVQAEIDLRLKLTKVMEDQAAIIASQALTPTKAPGAMGAIQPMAAEALPGYDLIIAAQEEYNAAVAAGQPGLKTFHDQIAAIALRHPELQALVTQLIAAGQAGIQLEQANFRLKAMEAALAGVATNAEMAAAGLGSLAQYAVNSQMAIETAAATERQAQAVLQLLAAYPGVTIETAKILANLDRQLPVLEAITGAEKIIAQEKARIAELVGQNRIEEEAIAIAAGERRNAEAAVDAQYQKQIQSLNDQKALIQARIDGTYEAVKAQQDYNNAIQAGASASVAAAFSQAGEEVNKYKKTQAEYDREQAKQSADLGQRMLAARREADAAAARREEDAARRQREINAANDAAIRAYNAQMEQALAAAQQMAHHWARIPTIITEIIYEMGRWIAVTSNLPQHKTWIDPNTGQAVQFNPEGYQLHTGPTQTLIQLNLAAKKLYGPGNYTEIESEYGTVIVPKATGELREPESLTELKEMTNAAKEILGGERKTQSDYLESKYVDALKGLTSSTDRLNATMQNALSPFYSQDPRTTRLGFRAGTVGNPDWMTGATNTNPLAAILGPTATAPGLANGGSFIVGGGYSANDNRIAAFPVASGEEIIVNRNRGGRGGPTVVNIDNRTMINGSVDADVMAKLKVTKFQQAQRTRGAMARL